MVDALKATLAASGITQELRVKKGPSGYSTTEHHKRIK